MTDSKSLTPLHDEDYNAIENAVMETARGRWFLAEYTKRHRSADTEMLLDAIKKLEGNLKREGEVPNIDSFKLDIADMASAIERTKKEIAQIADRGESGGRILAASNELDAIVEHTESATQEILNTAESVQELSFELREAGVDESLCDRMEEFTTNIYMACSFQDLTGQRTQKVVHVLRYLESRIDAMINIWHANKDEVAAAEPANVNEGDTRPDAHLLHGPQMPGEGADQNEIDTLLANEAEFDLNENGLLDQADAESDIDDIFEADPSLDNFAFDVVAVEEMSEETADVEVSDDESVEVETFDIEGPEPDASEIDIAEIESSEEIEAADIDAGELAMAEPVTADTEMAEIETADTETADIETAETEDADIDEAIFEMDAGDDSPFSADDFSSSEEMDLASFEAEALEDLQETEEEEMSEPQETEASADDAPKEDDNVEVDLEIENDLDFATADVVEMQAKLISSTADMLGNSSASDDDADDDLSDEEADIFDMSGEVDPTDIAEISVDENDDEFAGADVFEMTPAKPAEAPVEVKVEEEDELTLDDLVDGFSESSDDTDPTQELTTGERLALFH